MKLLIKSLLLVLTVSLSISCQLNKSEESTITDEGSQAIFNNLPKSKTIITANNEFSFNFFKEVVKKENKDNYLVSPVSLSLALGMAYNGSAAATKTAFETTLNYGDASQEEISLVNKNIITNLTNRSSGSLLQIANSIWVEEKFPIKDEFINLNSNFYSAQTEILNFSDPSSVTTINNWVAQKTNQKITSIIDNLSASTALILINALYFKADWAEQFNPKNNTTLPFYNSDLSSSIKVEMMTMTTDLKYSENDLFSSVILPYKNDKYKLTLLLPNLGQTTNDLAEAMDSQNWNSWQTTYFEQKVSITIPKFKFEYENELKDELISLGLEEAFSSSANFSGISDSSLLISSVLQKTFIDVNEEGTEAAAVTSTFLAMSALPQIFLLNRPFVFVISEKITGSICFIGKVAKPEYN